MPVHGLDALEQRVSFDLACLNYPPPNWVVPTTHPGSIPVTDVVVIGAGMAGLVLTFSLLRNGIRNVRCVDRNPAGFEGPWVTYARMETLRSPKVLTGPAAGIPSLTFRAWFVAQYGHEAWEELDKIPRLMWMDYLRWYRRILALPIENDVEVQCIRPLDNLLALDLADGTTILTRKTVMATGREGLGRPRIPDFIHPIPRRFWAHTADDIDFPALRNKRVIVIGGSASAMDNAAEALEHGCTELRLLIRRNDLPRINKLTGIGSAGFTHGYREMSEAWQWRTMLYSEETGPPAPRNSTLRVSRHPNAHFHLGSAIESIVASTDHITVCVHQPSQDLRRRLHHHSPPVSPSKPRHAQRSPPSPTQSPPGPIATRRHQNSRTPNSAPAHISALTSNSPRSTPAKHHSSRTSTASTTRPA